MMKIEVLESPSKDVISFLDARIAEYNWKNWEVSERLPLAIQITNDKGEIIAGAAGRTFGNWLQLNTLWVSEELRGKNTGSMILKEMEEQAKQRGCVKCILDTLDFQAMPFYKKHGYKIQWVQENYPMTGCKYFMVKDI